MLYKIDYTTRNERKSATRWVNHAADSTAAVKRFMNDFFVRSPDDAVRIDLITTVEIVGDMSSIDMIDAAVKESTDAR